MRNLKQLIKESDEEVYNYIAVLEIHEKEMGKNLWNQHELIRNSFPGIRQLERATTSEDYSIAYSRVFRNALDSLKYFYSLKKSAVLIRSDIELFEEYCVKYEKREDADRAKFADYERQIMSLMQALSLSVDTLKDKEWFGPLATVFNRYYCRTSGGGIQQYYNEFIVPIDAIHRQFGKELEMIPFAEPLRQIIYIYKEIGNRAPGLIAFSKTTRESIERKWRDLQVVRKYLDDPQITPFYE